MMKKKSQAALEFLMTYGWAFLVILVMIGALAYFGVLNPKNLMSSRCTATDGFVCEEYLVSPGQIQIVLKNNIGKQVVFSAATNISVTSGDIPAVTSTSAAVTYSPSETTPAGDIVTITQAVSNMPTSGEKFTYELKVPFTPQGGSLSKLITVTVFDAVQ